MDEDLDLWRCREIRYDDPELSCHAVKAQDALGWCVKRCQPFCCVAVLEDLPTLDDLAIAVDSGFGELSLFNQVYIPHQDEHEVRPSEDNNSG